MYNWKKRGIVFDPRKVENRPEWMHEFAQAPNVIIFDEYVRLYFCCRPKPDENKQFVSYCAFVDLDRKDLSKVINISSEPVMELGGLGHFDEFGTYPVSVIRDQDKVLAYYGGWTRCVSVPFNVSIGLAESTDNGVSFQKVGVGPVLTHSPEEPFVVTSPKIRKYNDTWYLAYTAGREWMIEDGRPEITYKIRLAHSDDGINWTKVNRDIIQEVLGEDEAQACPDITFSNGTYHMFFCYRKSVDFRRNPERSYKIGYASSTNMLDWYRDDSKVGIDISEDGWDSEMVAYPTVFELDGMTHMLYLGNEVGRFGIGLAQFKGALS